MKTSHVVFSVVLSFICAFKAVAAPVTYTFSATDFYLLPNYPENQLIPYDLIQGSFTIDDKSLIDIDLSIGSKIFNLSNAQYAEDSNSNAWGVFAVSKDMPINPSQPYFQLVFRDGSVEQLVFEYFIAGRDSIGMFLLRAGVFRADTTNVTVSTVPISAAFPLFLMALTCLGICRYRHN